jgi:hypothetical protein
MRMCRPMSEVLKGDRTRKKHWKADEAGGEGDDVGLGRGAWCRAMKVDDRVGKTWEDSRYEAQVDGMRMKDGDEDGRAGKDVAEDVKVRDDKGDAAPNVIEASSGRNLRLADHAFLCSTRR